MFNRRLGFYTLLVLAVIGPGLGADEQDKNFMWEKSRLGRFEVTSSITVKQARQCSWPSEDENPPLSARKAIAAADKYNEEIVKKVGDSKKLKGLKPYFSEAHLVPLGVTNPDNNDRETWHWSIKYEWYPSEGSFISRGREPKHEVWVLMTGEVIPFQFEEIKKPPKEKPKE